MRPGDRRDWPAQEGEPRHLLKLLAGLLWPREGQLVLCQGEQEEAGLDLLAEQGADGLVAEAVADPAELEGATGGPMCSLSRNLKQQGLDYADYASRQGEGK